MPEDIEVEFYAEKRADGWYVRMSSEGVPDHWEGPMRSRAVAMIHIELFCATNFYRVDPNESTEPIITTRKANPLEIFSNIMLNMRGKKPTNAPFPPSRYAI